MEEGAHVIVVPQTVMEDSTSKTLENSSSRKIFPPYNIMDDLLRVLLPMW
jgi:hypothetical protein